MIWGFKDKRTADTLKQLARKGKGFDDPNSPNYLFQSAIALFRVTEAISAAIVDPGGAPLTTGSGKAKRYIPDREDWYEVDVETLTLNNTGMYDSSEWDDVDIYNYSGAAYAPGSVIKAQRIYGAWFLDPGEVEVPLIVRARIKADFTTDDATFEAEAITTIAGATPANENITVENKVIFSPFESRVIGVEDQLVYCFYVRGLDEWWVISLAEYALAYATEPGFNYSVLDSPFGSLITVTGVGDYDGIDIGAYNVTGRLIFKGRSCFVNILNKAIIATDSPTIISAKAVEHWIDYPNTYTDWQSITWEAGGIDISGVTFSYVDDVTLSPFVRQNDRVIFAVSEFSNAAVLTPLQIGAVSRNFEKLAWVLAKPNSGTSPERVLAKNPDGTDIVWAVPPGGGGGGGGTYYSGCGLDVSDNTFSVHAADLAGAGLTTGSGCSLDVNVGCGLVINGENEIEVNSDDLAGLGLSTGTGCSLVVNLGCGLRFGDGDAGDEIEVDAEEIAGKGLVQQGSSCKIMVNAGCGIEVSEEDDKTKVKVEDLVGPGLKEGEGDCDITIDTGCGLEIDDDDKLTLKLEDIVGPGLKEGEEECDITIDTGCGLKIDENDKLTLKLEDILGPGLQEGSETDCDIQVEIGCGLTYIGNAIAVSPGNLAGPGLTTSGICGLTINYDCGLEIAASKLKVKPSDLAGHGLVPAGVNCFLDINYGCGLKIEEDVLLVDLDALAGKGLVPYEGTGSCALDVNPGCGIKVVDDKVEVDRDEIIGDYLEPQEDDEDGCKIQVQTALINVVEEIDDISLELTGTELIVAIEYTRRTDVRVIEEGDQDTGNVLSDYVSVIPCEE